MIKESNGAIRHFYNLEVWKDAHALSIKIYKITEAFPGKEVYGITDQIRRAATSVSANIAEGFGRFHFKEKIKFYYNARGSLSEVQNFIFFAQDLGYMNKIIARELFKKYDDLNKKLNCFIKSVQIKIANC